MSLLELIQNSSTGKDNRNFHSANITFLEEYFPKRNANDMTYKVLDFKNGDSDEIKYFSDRVSAYIKKCRWKNQGFKLAVVPSSQKGPPRNSVHEMAWNIVKNLGVFYEQGALYRYKSIQPCHISNTRDQGVHFNSIGVNSNVIGNSYILLDDIYTTGNTINACEKLLLQKGAERVIKMTIAKTIS